MTTRPTLAFAAVLLSLAAAAHAAEPFVPVVTPVDPFKIETRGATTFADFGKDAYANLQLTFHSAPKPATLAIRLGEKLNPDGTIDRKPPGSISYREATLTLSPDKTTYKLTLKPVKRPSYAHPVPVPGNLGEIAPFRYVEIDNAPALDKSNLQQLFVHAPFKDDASAFHSSDDTLNAVYNLCKHTMKATTAFGIYIDGERERTPYEADAYLNQLSHYAVDLNPDVARRSIAYLLDHPTWPTEWSSHMPMMAYEDYEATGDPVAAAAHYDALKKKLMLDKARPDDGLLVAFAIVDWPAAERDNYNDNQKSEGSGQMTGPKVNTVANAFYYHALTRMALLAKALNKTDDAAELDAKAKQVYAAFNKTFFNPATGLYTDGEGSTHSSLHANMLPLAFHLVPDDRKAKVADFIASKGMACSVYGAQYLLEALFNAGRADAAIALMNARTDRSWFHMIDLGSTMTLEAWDAKYKPNLTWNHAWGSVPANILARYVLGIRPLTPGYKTILIQPQPGTLAEISGKVPTPNGPVSLYCRQFPFTLSVEVPPNTTAKLILPPSAGATVTLDGRPLADLATLNTLPPGKHTIESATASK